MILFWPVSLFRAALLLHLPDCGNAIIKVVMRKENSCPNYHEFRISEVLLLREGKAMTKDYLNFVILTRFLTHFM
jgi:hypothetical protein